MGTSERIVVAAVVAAFAGCVYVAWFISQPAENLQPFDRVKWEQAALLDTSSDPGCFRGNMALDLINRKALSGKTGPEVVTLLGTPPDASSGSWLYPVGQCGVLWGHHNLQVTFGSPGKVKHAGLASAN